MKTNKRWTFLSLLLILAFVLSSCNLPVLTDKGSGTDSANETPINEETDTSAPSTIELGEIYGDVFSSYQKQDVVLPEKFTGGYTLPLTEDQITMYEGVELNSDQMEALLNNGFVVTPPDSEEGQLYSEFYQAYETYRYTTTPLFVTTDSIYHVYHLVFDKMLRDLERESFIPLLKELTTAMLDASLEQYDQVKGTDLEQAAMRNVAYFAVPAQILGLEVEIPSDAQSLADQEIALIDAHAGDEASPIWQMGNEAAEDLLIEDYTQYIPRGHYTRSEDLQNYFKAMMWYGRLTFRLKNTTETQRALLMIQAIRNAQTTSGKTALELWENIYDPTVFIVGKADDLSIYEYGSLSDQIFGSDPDLTSFSDTALMDQFLDAAKKLPAPQINSMWVYIWQDRDEATQGFRFMGQRFTLDEYIFGQMIYRKVGTIDKPRALPKSLDILAAMGSEEAYRILDEAGETDYENFDSQMTKVKTEVSELGTDSWTQNVYWSWLYALQPIIEPKGEQYPAFMQTQAWLNKDMQTALSSWSELKHDTILYSKQVMAEMGGGAEETPKGYIEPNPEAYARLLALAEMTRTGLSDRGILDETTQGNLDNLIDELEFMLDISQRELNGEEITEDDYWRIQYYGGWLEAMTIAAADMEDENQGRSYLEDQKSAVIADVATGHGKVLEEGVGYPTVIFVVSPVEPHPVLYGAVYTYYEFAVSTDERMTDEDWREMLETGNAPDAPEWTSSFIVP